MKYLTTKDLSKLFRRAPETIRYWIRNCHLDRYGQRFGREWLFAPEAVVAFMDEAMSSWYSEKQWRQARQALHRIRQRLVSENGHQTTQEQFVFKSYKMGALQGRINRKDLYGGR